MDSYFYKRFNFDNITPLGSHTGTNKTTKGTPDSYVRMKSGKYTVIAYGTVENRTYKKMQDDILACLNKDKTGIDKDDIEQIICCHTATNLSIDKHNYLCSLFNNVLLVGIGDLSQDILLRYQFLAKEYLNLSIDTNQIFDINDFIKYDSQNAYSTSLDMPLLFREKELEEIKKQLSLNTVIMITGKSGCGKTRLALQAGEEYAKENNLNLKIVKSNGEQIYDDIKTTFTDDKGWVIIVDDANQLLFIHHIFILCLENNRKYQLKILLTVRDYAQEQLIYDISGFTRPYVLNLKILDDNNIEEILKTNLGIINTDYLLQITKIAKGNVRLAIMAGTCSIKGSFDKIKNSFDIFELYFSEIIMKMDQDEVKVAALIAFFDTFTLSSDAMPAVIASDYKIPYDEFVDICNKLHNKEVISIYKDLGIKFENQNLRDYLLYISFYKARFFIPSYLIEKTFPAYRSRIVFTFNTLINLFNTKENLKYVEDEIRKVWLSIKDHADRNYIFQFIDTFCNVIPDETLLILKREINELPEVNTDFISFNFENNTNNHRIESKIIRLLSMYKYSSVFNNAVKLILSHLEKNTEQPMDFYFLLCDEWGIDKDSSRFNYSQELLLLELLSSYYKENDSDIVAICLIIYSSSLLKLNFTSTESKNNDSVTFYNFGLLPTSNLYKLRENCFNIFSELYHDNRYHKTVCKYLFKYFIAVDSDNDRKIIDNDFVIIESRLKGILSSDRFDDCLILRHFSLLGNRNNINNTSWLYKYENNQIFHLYLSLSKNPIDTDGDFENEEKVKKEEIHKLFISSCDDDITELWYELSKNKELIDDEWNISAGISEVFVALSSFPNRFLLLLDSYIRNNTPFDTHIRIIIGCLISVIGYKQATIFISNIEFKNKTIWLYELYDSIPEHEITSETPVFFINKLEEQINENSFYTLSIKTVLLINNYYPDFLVRYIDTMNNEKNGLNVVSSFFRLIDCYHEENAVAFVSHFTDQIQVLERAYILGKQGKMHFDNHGVLLKHIVRKDKYFLATFVKDTLTYRIESGQELEFIWYQDNYDELVTLVLDTIMEMNESLFLYDYYISEKLFELINRNNNDKKQINWLKDYIQKHSNEKKVIIFIFKVISNFEDEVRLTLICHLCKCNASFEIFSSISILPTRYGWSGSEAPLLDGQMSFLNQLKTCLYELDYVEHRTYINEYIQHIQEYKESVLLQEFIERR